MKYIAASHTDLSGGGVNQDALALQVLSIKRKKAVMAVVCDGLCGLKMGEEASGRMAKALAQWFQEEFIGLVWEGFSYRKFRRAMLRVFSTEHKRIAAYGRKNKLLLGTTACVLLLYRGRYYTAHVGDTRAYRFRRRGRRLTADHGEGENALFFCVGSSACMKPEFGRGFCHRKDLFLVCSDGFRRRVTIREMTGILHRGSARTVTQLQRRLFSITELCKHRGEKDNISVCAVKVL